MGEHELYIRSFTSEPVFLLLLKAKGSQPRYGLGVARGSNGSEGSGMVWCRPGVWFKEGSRGSRVVVQARCKIQDSGEAGVWCRPARLRRCKVQARARQQLKAMGLQRSGVVRGAQRRVREACARVPRRFCEGSARVAGMHGAVPTGSRDACAVRDIT